MTTPGLMNGFVWQGSIWENQTRDGGKAKKRRGYYGTPGSRGLRQTLHEDCRGPLRAHRRVRAQRAEVFLRTTKLLVVIPSAARDLLFSPIAGPSLRSG